MNKHYQIVIIGGGTAGVTVASRLLKKKSKLKRENSNYRSSRPSLLSTIMDVGWCRGI